MVHLNGLIQISWVWGASLNLHQEVSALVVFILVQALCPKYFHVWYLPRVPSLNATFGFIIHCISLFPLDSLYYLTQRTTEFLVNSHQEDSGIYQMSPPSGSPLLLQFQVLRFSIWRKMPRFGTLILPGPQFWCGGVSTTWETAPLFYFLKEYSSHVIYILLPKVEWKDWSLGPVLSEKHFPFQDETLRPRRKQV